MPPQQYPNKRMRAGDSLKRNARKRKISLPGLDRSTPVWYYPTRTGEKKASSAHQEPWCSGLTCLPVTQKIAGSNPVGSVRTTPVGHADTFVGASHCLLRCGEKTTRSSASWMNAAPDP